MNLQKAIEILMPYSKPPLPFVNTDFCDAVKLGIKALERIEDNRLLASPVFISPLPGETED